MSEPSSANDLHPWRTILAVLFDLDADSITHTVNLSGLVVDWDLTSAEAYSNNTRKRAYLPKITSAYANLPDDKKLIAAWIIATHIGHRDTNLGEKLNASLFRIGWKVDPEHLTPITIEAKELFFPTRTQYDAYLEIKKIFQKATRSATIIDPYIDETIFQLVSVICIPNFALKILSSKLPTDFALAARKFRTQYSSFTLEVRRTREFHDRFVILDDNQCFHLGASIKDAGNKVFMISQLEDQSNIDSLNKQFLQSWNSSAVFNF